ncbi:Aste57867_24687 [Aphanomyces stellatus]|uniref:Aste57867_24687 protein n=1 Tax=Aphanomyces stellatus TaxID=120398 RepID=A0A485LS40_9STRA|nr:hypothetical protein As57867_024609 [Aphanomyces stellatus]VFU01324.1 Aste57867_24687 [Aphanomyces stellatus]
MPTVSQEVLREAGRVMLGYAASFFFAIVMQLSAKIRAVQKFKKDKAAGTTKEKFNRYTSDTMLAGDRSVGNFIEWQGLFLVLFWTNVLVAGAQDVWLGWVYVGSRFLYPILAQLGGIKQGGPMPLIFLATVPGYYVLFHYTYLIYRTVFN